MDLNKLILKYKNDVLEIIDEQYKSNKDIRFINTDDEQLYIIDSKNKHIENYSFKSTIYKQVGTHYSIDVKDDKLLFHSSALSLNDTTEILNECESYMLSMDKPADVFLLLNSLDRKPIHTLINILNNTNSEVKKTRFSFYSFPQFLNIKTMIDAYESVEKGLLIYDQKDKKLNLHKK